MTRDIAQQAHGTDGDDGGRTAGGNHGQLDTGHRQQADDIRDIEEGLGHDGRGERASGKALELVLCAHGGAEAEEAKEEEQRDDEEAAPQAHLFADDGEDKVVTCLRQVEPLGARLAKSHPREPAIREREETLVRLEASALRVLDIAHEGIEVRVETIGAVAAAGKEHRHADDRKDEDEVEHRLVHACEEERENCDEGKGHAHAHIALGDDEAEHAERDGGVLDEGILEVVPDGARAVHAKALVSEQVRAEEGDGDTGNLRRLDGNASDDDPRLGANLLAASADGGQHDEEQRDGEQEQPHRRGAPLARRDAQAQPETEEAGDDHERLAQGLLPHGAVFGHGGRHGRGVGHEHADAHEREHADAQHEVVQARARTHGGKPAAYRRTHAGGLRRGARRLLGGAGTLGGPSSGLSGGGCGAGLSAAARAACLCLIRRARWSAHTLCSFVAGVGLAATVASPRRVGREPPAAAMAR